MKVFRVLGVLAAATFVGSFGTAAEPPSVGADAVASVAKTIPASDSRFGFEGRFDAGDADAPVAIWQASRIRVVFEGDAIALRFGDLKGQVFFNATVDDRTTVVAFPEHSDVTRVPLSGYGPGRHQLVLFKRSEANAGTIRFLGVELPDGGRLLAAASPRYATRMLFLGDSITVGACNEDGSEDQWEDRRTHDAALSYAALTASAFQADHRNISVSGMGIAVGWVPQLAGDTWDRVYPDPHSPRADLTRWRPDVVFLNFGENDDSYTARHLQPFPANFSPRYVALVRAVRQAFPQAEIVILRGGMGGGATSERLRYAWKSAVVELEKTDSHVSDFVFTHWSKNHPRVADDRIMADELVKWLRKQPFRP